MDLPIQQDELGRVVALCSAIFHAEGFWVASSRPRQHHNPGDMLGHDGLNIQYADFEDGAAAAAHQVMLMLRGESHVYSLAMTWRRVAQLWTGGDNADQWCESVCDDLGVLPDSTLGAFAAPLALAAVQQLTQQTAPAPTQPAPTPGTQG
jgi:hypothetical protein